jgi:hypothetical protein
MNETMGESSGDCGSILWQLLEDPIVNHYSFPFSSVFSLYLSRIPAMPRNNPHASLITHKRESNQSKKERFYAPPKQISEVKNTGGAKGQRNPGQQTDLPLGFHLRFHLFFNLRFHYQGSES